MAEEGLHTQARTESRKAARFPINSYGRIWHERTAQALTIASRVLADDAAEKLARIIAGETDISESGESVVGERDASVAIIAYLRGEK